MTLDWREAFTYPTRCPGGRAKIAVGGLLILLAFPVGWLMALGYRKAVAFRIVEGHEPALPGWRTTWQPALCDGLRAAGVILVYFLPFLLLYGWLALDDLATAVTHARQIALLVLAIPLALPVSLPLLPPLFAARYDWLSLSVPETAALAVLFLATTFVLPSAFLRVSLHGRFRCALELRQALGFIARAPRAYLEAWWLSLVATALAGLSGPFVPWGIFWSYLAIVHLFNQALARSETAGVRERFAPHSRCLGPARPCAALTRR